MQATAFSGIVRLLVAMAVTFSSVAAWNTTAEAATCATCHAAPGQSSDIRPLDAAYRNITTGAFPGNHQTHLGSDSPAAACAKCHGAAAESYTASHRNAAIEISATINSSPVAATYSKGTSFPQTTSPTLGSCSNVNCHFETVTPTWGGAAFSAPADCDKCHGAPPDGTGTSGVAGSHAKHDTYYSGPDNCQKCHSNNTTFSHATSAGHRNLNISFAASPNNGSGAYSGALNDYLPSQTNVFGSCSNLYCHSPGNKAVPDPNFSAPNQPATWGGTLSCKGCHKENFDGSSSISSGSHPGHIYSWGGLGARLACVKCHAATTTAGMSISNISRHVDGLVTVAFNNSSSASSGRYNGTVATPASPMSKTPGSAPATCSTVYCHSTGQGDGGTWPPTYTTPTWGTAASGICGTCHGIQKTHGNGSGFYIGTATPLTTGSHSKHLAFMMGFTGAEKCAACHAYTLTGFSPTSCNSSQCHTGNLVQASHPNYAVNVGIPNYFGASAAYNGTTRPGDGYGSCSSVYCHSDGKATPTTYAAVTWGDPVSGACGTCHGVSAAAPPASVPHVKHVGAANQYRYACAECHSGKVQVTADSTVAPAFTNLTSHVDKIRNVKFDASNAFGTYSTATLSCRNLYCHSTGNISVAAGDLPAVYNGKVYARQTWNGTVSCNSCHGRSTSNGMPDYANAGAAGSATANSHLKHVTNSALACVECHEKTTKSGTTIRSAIPSRHVNGSGADVFFNLSGFGAAGVYTSATKTCNTVACHSNGRGTYMPAQWGTAATCDYCHPIASLGGSHAKHVDLTQMPAFYSYTANNSNHATHNFGCSNCHPLSGVMHTNGVIALDLRPVAGSGTLRAKNSAAITTSGAAGPANNGTTADSVSTSVVKCRNVYCHSNGYSSNTVFATTPNWYGGTFSGDRCAACHGNSPNSTIAGSPAHYSSNFDGAGNPGGHIVGIHYDNIFNGTSGLATPGPLSTSSHGDPITSTSLNCDNCHFETVESRNNDKNTVCATCHNGANLRGDAVIASRMTHVNGRPDVVFDAIQVRSKAQMMPQTNYTSVFTRVVGYKVNGAYDIAKTAFDTATMWDSSTKTCSNISCHFNKPITWGNVGTANKCLICHDSM